MPTVVAVVGCFCVKALVFVLISNTLLVFEPPTANILSLKAMVSDSSSIVLLIVRLDLYSVSGHKL